MAHQQPARETLLYVICGIGQRREGCLNGHHLSEPQKQRAEIDALLHRMGKVDALDPVTLSGNLHKARIGRGRIVHDERSGKHSFPAKNTNLCLTAATHFRDDGRYASIEKITVIGDLAR